ncbi:recombinase family protein (plasmid) [Bacillus thuringiensis]|uniref:recombinase family protein n=1 Tax=Bacillus thuringiensis TaxID=1428 RepID=UPI00105E2E34|nr:recombinase family protein [Bacillus thuringiensis]QBP15753.1 recombinase family protein [Bacillus thuringiensis]QBP17032.1 recombinase family protein [Bacillus thuringiensis]
MVTNIRGIQNVANIYGYIRVSTKEQNEQRQLHKMMERGVEARRIFVDKASGRNFDRPQYQLLRKILGTGDIVYIDALDRMGRNYDEVISEWKYITRELQADIVVLENETLFDSRKFREMGDMGRLMEDQFLSLLSYVADQERKKIHQRQAEGIAVAKSQGKHLGRPQLTLATLSSKQLQIIEETYPKWKNREITGIKFMELIELKKNTFYKIIKEFEVKKGKMIYKE